MVRRSGVGVERTDPQISARMALNTKMCECATKTRRSACSGAFAFRFLSPRWQLMES